MALETATYIDGLVTTNPTGLDPKSQGDDHIRLLKSTIKATLPNITGAVTASQAELNILDGATLSTAELNILDGVTATTAELNFTDGVTSNIQTQLDAKAPLVSPALTGTPTAPTAVAGTDTTQIATTAHVFAERTNTATLTNKTLTAPVINSPTGLVKADVGLGNVDNTSDANKPVSTATQTALNGKQDLDADLTALAGLATTGLIARTGAGAAATRTLTAGAGVAIANGDGVAGNPTISVTPGVGTGDVLGPAGATDGHAAVFDGATGKVIRSMGSAPVSKAGDTMTGPLAQAAGTAALPSYTFSGNTGTGMWSPGADTWAVSTGGSERLRIDASGNVGIGGAPSVRFHVQGGRSALFPNAEQYAIQLNYSIGTGANGHFLGGDSDGSFVLSSAGGTERLRIDTSGNVLVTGSGGLGYGVGSGGTVTQATSKSTTVTLNKPSGRITMNAASLAAGATVVFLVANSTVTATDTVSLVTVAGSAGDPISDYRLRAGAIAAGQFFVAVTNESAGAKAEALQIQFNVHKGATS